MVLEVAAPHNSETPNNRFNEAALAMLGVPVSRTSRSTARVAIGFVDYGFDLLHPCLRDTAGDVSRFRFFWDQNRQPEAARTADFDIAAVEDWDGAFLDAAVSAAKDSGSRRALDAMYDPHANNCGRDGTIGAAHGTLMASIAAATASGGFRSAAPDAELIGVQLALLDSDWKEQDDRGRPTWLDATFPADAAWDGWRSYDDAAQIGNAIRYLYDRACQLCVEALVINLSIGAWAGAHDGASPAERAITDLQAKSDAAWQAGKGPRTIVVAGAGNAGADEGHWFDVVSPEAPQSFDWVMQHDDPTQNKLEIWYESDAALDLEITLPDATVMRLTPGGTHAICASAKRIGIADHTFKARGALSRVRVLLHARWLGQIRPIN